MGKEVLPGGIPAMLLPKSTCVCIPCIDSVAPRVCWPKYHFWPDMKIEMDVVISVLSLLVLH